MTLAVIAGVCLGLLVAALAIPVNALVSSAAQSIPNPLLDIFKPQAQRSIVYASDGTVLTVLHATENRSPVSINVVPQVVINAVLDTEDARFFTHGGIDIKSTVRALASDVRSGAAVQGASTITQQLVKTVLNTPEKTLDRKIKDAVISTRLEGRFSKRQILEAYLNTVYFGSGAYGVQAAAETYFNADISKITADQAALMAGIIRDPHGYDPILNPHDSLARRNFVLDRMVTLNHLTAAEAASLKSAPIPTAITPPQSTADPKDDYYVEQVKQILLNKSTTLGSTYTERYNALFKGGLKIYTNLDPRLQDLAEQAVANTIPANPQGFTGALVSVEPSTGKVKAVIGGPGYDKYKFDLATQAVRQPGSGFKLFTLLATYEAGFGPYDSVDGSSPCAVKFGSNISLLKQPINNDEGKSAGPISVAAATANSVNCAFIRMAHEAGGLQKVVDMAHRLGLSQPFPLNPSLVIGSEETTVLEMADAYATLASDGMYHKPQFIDRIVDGTGHTIYTEDTTGKRVLDPQISREAVMTLRGVVQFGTGTAAALPDQPVAGKTGTTELNTDAWFNGFTPQLATSVWMGDPKGRTSMYSVGGITVFGGTYPARIWHTFTAGALAGQAVVDFPAPDPNKIPAGRFIGPPPAFTVPTSVTPKVSATVPTGPSTTTTGTTIPTVTVPGSIPFPTFPTFPTIPTTRPTVPVCRRRCNTTTT